jgi:hypothetical protein
MLGSQDLEQAVRTELNSDNVHLPVVDFTMVLRSIVQDSTDTVLLAGLCYVTGVIPCQFKLPAKHTEADMMHTA